jgi:hypothetical protein
MSEYKTEAGSEGSRVGSDNIRKYGKSINTVSEAHSPSQSDHPVAPPEHKLRTPAANEVVRRDANRQRDNSRRFGIINSPMGVTHRDGAEKK